MKARRISFEADRDLGLSSVDDGDAAAVGDSLVTDCARVRSLGVGMGCRVKVILGKVGSQRGVLGYLDVFVGEE